MTPDWPLFVSLDGERPVDVRPIVRYFTVIVVQQDSLSHPITTVPIVGSVPVPETET